MSFQDTIKTGFGHFQETMSWYPDSLITFTEEFPQLQTMNDSIQGTFLHPLVNGSLPTEITPLLRVSSPHDWLTNMLLLQMAFIVVLWFVMPNRRNLFQQIKQSFKSQSDIAHQKPGFLFPFFFYLNYLVVVILFVYVAIQTIIQPHIIDESQTYLIVVTSFIFVGYSLYKLVFIVLAGFLFKTRDLAFQQIRFYIDIDNMTGFLALSILILFLSTQSNYFFYFFIFIILIANAIKWFQTIVIGKSNSTFSLYHLIIYLCTLEIIPLLLLIKFIENQRF